MATMDGGMDIGMKDHHKNWAVIAFSGAKGKQDFVKFIDLSNLNYRECFDWMKRLESLGVKSERFMYDAPMGIKESFYPFRD